MAYIQGFFNSLHVVGVAAVGSVLRCIIFYKNIFKSQLKRMAFFMLHLKNILALRFKISLEKKGASPSASPVCANKFVLQKSNMPTYKCFDSIF